MNNDIIQKKGLLGLMLSVSLLSQVAIATDQNAPLSDQTQILAFKSEKLAQSITHENAHQVVRAMRDEWAHIKYEMPKNDQLPAFEALIKKAEKWSLAYPKDASVALWYGTIFSTYASVKGGLGALPSLKEARAFLEKSISLNSNIDMGLAHGVLGAIYYRIPGWPIAFGDKEKAKKQLILALQLGPESIDNNYYYGDFLRVQGDYAQAKKFLLTAKSIEPRKDRVVADKGRLTEIETALKEVEEKLN